MKKAQTEAMTITQFESIEELEDHTVLKYTQAERDEAVREARIGEIEKLIESFYRVLRTDACGLNEVINSIISSAHDQIDELRNDQNNREDK